MPKSAWFFEAHNVPDDFCETNADHPVLRNNRVFVDLRGTTVVVAMFGTVEEAIKVQQEFQTIVTQYKVYLVKGIPSSVTPPYMMKEKLLRLAISEGISDDTIEFLKKNWYDWMFTRLSFEQKSCIMSARFVDDLRFTLHHPRIDEKFVEWTLGTKEDTISIDYEDDCPPIDILYYADLLQLQKYIENNNLGKRVSVWTDGSNYGGCSSINWSKKKKHNPCGTCWGDELEFETAPKKVKACEDA